MAGFPEAQVPCLMFRMAVREAQEGGGGGAWKLFTVITLVAVMVKCLGLIVISELKLLIETGESRNFCGFLGLMAPL